MLRFDASIGEVSGKGLGFACSYREDQMLKQFDVSGAKVARVLREGGVRMQSKGKDQTCKANLVFDH